MPPDRSALMARMAPSISQITPHLYLGNASSSLNCKTLQTYGITSIVSLLERRYEWWSRPENQALVPTEHHLFVPCQDTSTMDILAHLTDICDFIDQQLGILGELGQVIDRDETASVQTGTDAGTGTGTGAMERNVLVHCELGISRSASVVIAYLMRSQRKSLGMALSAVNRERAVKPSDNFMEQLRVWEEVGFQVWEDGDGRVPKRAYQRYLDGKAGKS